MKSKKLKTYTIAEAKNRFPEVVRQAETSQVVEVTRRGQPVAMVVSVEEYRKLTGQNSGSSQSFWEAVEEFRASPDFEPIDNPEEIFRRDPETDSDWPNPWL